MSIEKSLERIATALENSAKPPPTDQTVQILHQHPDAKKTKPDPEPEHANTLDDVRAAVEQFLPDRREEAVLLMAGFKAEKIGDFKPDQYTEVIAKFNAEFHS